MTVVYSSKATGFQTALILAAGGAVGGFALLGPVGGIIGGILGGFAGAKLAKASEKDGGLQLVDGNMAAPTFPGGTLTIQLPPLARWDKTTPPFVAGSGIQVLSLPTTTDNDDGKVAYSGGGGYIVLNWLDGSKTRQTTITFS